MYQNNFFFQDVYTVNKSVKLIIFYRKLGFHITYYKSAATKIQTTDIHLRCTSENLLHY